MGRLRSLAVLAGSVAASVCLYAGTAVMHLDRVCIPLCGQDPALYVWMFGWMHRALMTGASPFFSRLIGAPEGTSLHWVTTVSTQALLGSPFTGFLGPRASYNIMVILGVALAGWASYLLCLEVTGRHWPSIAGGGLFLLSSYMVLELIHLNLLFVAPVLLLVRSTVRFGKGAIGVTWYLLTGAVLLVAQFFASTEVFASMTLFAGVAVVMHLVLDHSPQEIARRVVLGVIGAYVICAVLLTPFLKEALASQPRHPWVPLAARSVSVPEMFVPSHITALGAWAGPLRHWAGIEERYPDSGAQGYLALPVLLLLVAAWRDRERYPRMLLPFIGTVLLLSLGPRIEVFRGFILPGPQALIAGLPLLEHAFPKRFPLYAWIGCSVVLAIWVAGRPPEDRSRTALWLTIGAVCLLPSAGLLVPARPVPIAAPAPQMFRDGDHRWFVREDDIVLVLGSITDGIEWQVASKFGFRLAEGYLGPYAPWGFLPLLAQTPPPDGSEAVAGLLARRHVDWVALPTGLPSRWRPLLAEVSGGPSITFGGVDLFPVRLPDALGSGAAAGPISSAARDAYRRGVGAVAEGRLTEAAAAFRDVLAVAPGHAPTHIRLAEIYLAYGNEHLAEVHLRAALASDPDSVGALVELARLWDAAGRRDAAGALYRRAYLLRPSALTDDERVRVEALLSGSVSS